MVDSAETRSETTLQAYDAIAPMYENYSMSRSAYLAAIENLVIERLSPEDRLLDVGAGDGRRTARIVQKAGITDYLAVEPSQEMAKICRQNLAGDVREVLAEKIDELHIGQFSVALTLWNVLGHVRNSDARLTALKCIADKLIDGGILMLDVNNRHNATAYGAFTVAKRVLIDSFFFDEKRGDANYDWNIEGKIFKSSGHLFVAQELETLVRKAGFKLRDRYSVDYQDGHVFRSPFKGQLFYVLEKSAV
ncbi:class I SAM-dependent methyltransferase [Thalassospira tepidiphila]|jgi:SAM-dependent methyltransferase|uniref:class I SAM-dependent methyltransferase n=1 Tax=Thalassospira tepidiphila TaxID=393657 RepID=UPI00292022D0|nr:hypothetical protein MACH01_31110 [Thalassospira tepidiphila]